MAIDYKKLFNPDDFNISEDMSEIDEILELKINGATTLSHLIRSYIHTNTAISGIIVPMINFVQFFKENEIE